jgi:DNA polymerase sigma
VSNNTAKIEKKAQYINIIINKMNLIVAEMFSGSIFLYGSYATGLAIDSSDVDIGISTTACFTRESVQKACIDLGSFLEKLPFVVACQKIITAKVPVVKLEVDLLCFSGTSCKVMFDLTFMNYLDGGHCGLLAINFTKDLMILFPHIQYLAIVLKSFLYSHKLNSAYHGNL